MTSGGRGFDVVEAAELVLEVLLVFWLPIPLLPLPVLLELPTAPFVTPPAPDRVYDMDALFGGDDRANVEPIACPVFGDISCPVVPAPAPPCRPFSWSRRS